MRLKLGKMKKSKVWISAFRIRTLPLALASILLGSFLAAAEGAFSWPVALLCVATAILLQLLSNLANDYGDSVHGADSDLRTGPQRATQSGKISASAMRAAILVFVALCLSVGYILIRNESIVFHIAGLAAIAAAIAYTAGPKPYGYVGLGDIFVFLFFGIVGVSGSYFLHTHQLNYLTLLPATACGCFCVAVLNINNIRDTASDEAAGKITIPVRLGADKARLYHWALLLLGFGAAVVHLVITYRNPWQFLFFVSLPLILKNGIAVSRQKDNAQLDPYLKKMALSTLLFCLSFGVGNLF